MLHRPPPLQWLPAFEAAARHLSFSLAAEELHVSTSAIGQQIRQLEAHLGQRLFLRLTRRVALTEAGAAYAALCTPLLSGFRQGHERFMKRHALPALRISMTPLVAHELILPALAEFQATHPGTTLQIESTMALADFQDQGLDAALRFGAPPWPGLMALPLSRCRATLVAAPGLLQSPLRGPNDLAACTLIHQRADQRDWDQVAAHWGVPRLPRRSDLVLDSNLSALRAAEQGLGVAIAVWPLVQPWLDQGRLVALLPPMALAEGDHFVFRADDPQRERLLAVHAWIRSLFLKLDGGGEAA
jgi:LysR family transcriptional regulator, glycine cleavage system transcriptional activator